jgi:hypothetical protein
MGAAGGDMGAGIESIQQIEQVGFASAIKDVTITEVDTSKTMILYGGQDMLVPSDTKGSTIIRLLDSTTVRFQVGTLGGTQIVRATVVGFSSGINNIQRGVTSLSGASPHDVTITEVDLSKAWVNFLGMKDDGDISWSGNTIATMHLLNSTTLRIARNYTLQPMYASWEVVEFL